jgi:hypothetical protein
VGFREGILIQAEKAYFAMIRFIDIRQDSEQGSFTGAVESDQSGNAGFWDLSVDFFDSRKALSIFDEVFLNFFNK